MILNPTDLRSLVVECLRRDRPFNPSAAPFQIANLCGEVAQLTKDRTIEYKAGINAWQVHRNGYVALHDNVVPQVWTVVWDLIIEGIIRPGDELRETSLPCIYVTPYGKEALKGGITPYDPDGYLTEIADKTPSADKIIVQYIAESAESLRRNCLL